MALERFIEIKGVPLRGGAVTVREKSSLAPGQFSMVQNLRGKYPGFEKRAGQIKKHSTADGTNQVVSLYQFKKTRPSEDHVYALMSDGDILEATDLPPTVTTGVFGSEFWSGTTSPLPPSWSNLNDMLLFANGVDQHQIYPGDSSKVSKFVVYKGSTNPATLKGVIEEGEDYSQQVTDGQTSTVGILDDLKTFQYGNGIFINTPVPAKSFTVTVSAANANVSMLAGYYWKNDSSWALLSGFTDGTASGGATFAQTGTITFTEPTDIQDKFLFGRPGYWYLIGPTDSAFDDLTGYTEVDSGTDIGVATNSISITTIENNVDSYVVKSYGASYWGDFKVRFSIVFDIDGNGATAPCVMCGFANGGDYNRGDFTTNTDGVTVQAQSKTAGEAEYNVTLADHEGSQSDVSADIAKGTETWIELERSGTTLTAKLYSDQTFETLIETLTITGAPSTAYQYHYAFAAGVTAAGNNWSGTIDYYYQTAGYFDSEVEITDVTYDASMGDVKNIWDGVVIPAVEVMVEGTSQFETYGATAVDLDTLAASKKIYIGSTDPVEAIYIDVGAVPNAAGTALTTLKYWDGSAWTSVGTVVDGTGGMVNSGWLSFPRQSDVHPLHFESVQYYAYWYEMIWDSQLAADMNVGIYLMPYYNFNEFGYVGRVSAAWKNRAVYTFKDKFQEYIYISATNNPQGLNGPDYTILEMGDGRAHEIVAMKKFFNELMVWQEEKGSEGGTLTLVQGYSVETFGKLVLSTRLGTYSQKTVDVVENFKTSTASNAPVIKTIAIVLCREGVYMCDGKTIWFISDDVQNYFDKTKPECIRRGYNNQHWVKYDPTYNVLRVGIVSGDTATKPNVFLVYDLTDNVWYFDSLAQELSCAENMGAASGDYEYVQLGGGIDDGTVYILNTGTADVTTAIDSYIQIELNAGGQWLDLLWLMLQEKAQTGTVVVYTYQNGILKDTISLNSAAEIATQEARRHFLSLNVKDPTISVKIQNSSATESFDPLNVGLEVKIWDNR